MTVRKILAGVSVFGLATSLALPAMAGGIWTGTLGAASDYVFRGITQSDGDPAVNGSIEYSQDGIAVGVWASSIDFPADPGADVEIDLYASYTHGFSDNTSLTGKVVYYLYPGANTPDADYVELLAQLDHNFGKFSANLNVAYTPDYFGGSSDATWFGAGIEVPLCDWATLSANVGHQWFDSNFPPAAPFVDLPDYAYGDIGVTLAWEVIALDIRYVATDIDRAECFSGTDSCDSKLVATLTFTKSSGDE